MKIKITFKKGTLKLGKSFLTYDISSFEEKLTDHKEIYYYIQYGNLTALIHKSEIEKIEIIEFEKQSVCKCGRETEDLFLHDGKELCEICIEALYNL